MPLVRCNGTQIHYQRVGAGSQNLLFVHGLRNSGATWRLQDQLNPKVYTAWLIDLPGCGNSPAPDDWQSCTIEQYTADVVGFCEAMKLTDLCVVGHSLGGAIAISIALDRPDMLAGMVVVAPASTQGIDFVSAEHIDALINADEDEVRAFGHSAFFAQPEENLSEWLMAIVLSAHSNHTKGALLSMRDFRVKDRLGEIRIPTLVVAGDRDGHVPVRYTLETAAAIPRCAVQIYHNVGHTPFWEVQDEFVTLLDEFVQSDIPATRARTARAGQ